MTSSALQSTDVDIRSLLRTAWRRRTAVLIGLNIGLLTAIFVATSQPVEYAATVDLIVRGSSVEADKGSGVADFNGGSIDNEVRLIGGSVIAAPAAKILGYYPFVTVKGSPNTDFIRITAKNQKPERAAQDAQEVAEQYQKYRRKSVVDQIQRTIDELKRRGPIMTREIEKLDREIQALPLDSEQRASLTSIRQGSIDSMKFYNERVSLLSIEAAVVTGGVSIVTPASVPTSPVSVPVQRLVLIGILVGIATATLLATIASLFDDRIQNSSDVTQVTSIPVLGAVPRVRAWRNLALPTVFTETAQAQRAGEAYRAIRAALQHAMDRDGGKVVQITSAGPRAGKTTTAINLGALFGWSGSRAILVDLDLRSPKAGKSLGLDPTVGFSEVVYGDLSAMAVIQPTTHRGSLFALPAGVVQGDPSETIARAGARRVFHELARQSDIVIVDSGALRPYSDALVALPLVDFVVLVVRAGKTRARHLVDALDAIESSGGHVAGIVVTAVVDAERWFTPRAAAEFGPSEVRDAVLPVLSSVPER